jgi:sulfur carrier protein
VIEIRVNGQPRQVAQDTSLRDLLVQLGVDPTRKGIAVAVSGEVVPRSQWERTAIVPGANVEIVTASQGG